MWPRKQVVGALYVAMVGWKEFEKMTPLRRVKVASSLEARCAREAKDLLEYGILVGKLVGLLSDVGKEREPGTFSRLVAAPSLSIPDSELCPNLDKSLKERIARKEASKIVKIYSQRHRCPQCHDPMRYVNEHLIARSGDEATKVVLECDRCPGKKVF